MRTIEALFILAFKLPLQFLGYLAKNKILLILVLFLVGGFFIYNNATKDKVVAADYYIQVAPSVTQAPTLIQTTSRLYYVKSYTDDEKVITLTDWYSYDYTQKKWLRNTQPFFIDRTVYGLVTVSSR